MEEKRPVRVLLKKASSFFNNKETEPESDVYGTGLFHEWEDHKNAGFSCKYGIVELADGTVRRFDPQSIQFIDSVDYKKLSVEKLIGKLD